MIADGLAEALLLGLLAGAAIPAGAGLARIEELKPLHARELLRHAVIAFGGGVLIGAVAFVLAPQGSEVLGPLPGLAAFLAGTLGFAALDRAASRGGPKAQLIAMLTDFVPEAAALGALIATGSEAALLLAVLIAQQNLPEGFNAFHEAESGGGRPARILARFAGLGLLGPGLAAAGFLVLADMPTVTACLMLVASGGIVYLTFEHIAVQAHLRRNRIPSITMAAGVAFAMLGHALTG